MEVEKMSKTQLPKPWYKKWWGILLIFLFFPILIPYLVWTKTNWNMYIKIGITAICIIFLGSSYFNYNQELNEAQDLVNQAENYISEGKINEALEAINKSKQLNPRKEENTAFLLEEKINKLNSDDFMKITIAEMSDSDFELLKNGKLETVYIDNAVLNSIFLDKLAENADKRTEYIAEVEEQKRLAEIEAEKKRKEEELKQRKKMIEEQFSAWDGSHINLTRAIKDAMNDPGSYEHIETVYWDRGDHLLVKTTFRGKNAFGALIKDTVVAKITFDGEIIEMQ